MNIAIPTLAVIAAAGASACLASAGHDWPAYLGDKGATHYSSLDQITPDNVGRLTPVWTWHTGDARPDVSQIQCNPLVIDGVLYATTAQMALAAVDASTGGELWRFHPDDPNGVNRGLAYWRDGDDRRILFANSHWLYAVDARTGRPVANFGVNGRVDLSQDLGRDVSGLAIQANTPGVIFRDLLILGMRVGEGPAPSAPGHIRAYNVRTGTLAWRFRTIPYPGEPGYETWPADAWTRVGGANAWAGMTVDETRGLVFCPVGSASFDFWGGDRIGDNLYANCLLALDAATGRRAWHYQFVRHDIWDRDPPAPPVLFTMRRDGRDIPAVAQITKSGHVFVFHRETGEPLFPIREIAVPASDLAGEVTVPTQRLPVAPEPFARQLFTATEITDRTPEAHRAVLERFARLRPHVPFAPPSREGTIIFPGFDGGGEWGGPAVDRDGILYVNANEMPWILTMIDASHAGSPGEQLFLQNCTGCHGANREGNTAANIPSLRGLESRLSREQVLEVLARGRGVMPSWGFLSLQQRESLADFLLDHRPAPAADQPAPAAPQEWVTYVPDTRPAERPAPPYTHTGYNRFLDPDGYPAVKPPWGTLNAIDLTTGTYRWRVPLGEFPELTAQGVPPTGTENYGGPVVTAGGVLFIGASRDENFRAFDSRTGRELWRFKLPAAAYATPATYSIGGRQFIVVACGGGKLGTRSGDAYMAFALPPDSGPSHPGHP